MKFRQSWQDDISNSVEFQIERSKGTAKSNLQKIYNDVNSLSDNTATNYINEFSKNFEEANRAFEERERARKEKEELESKFRALSGFSQMPMDIDGIRKPLALNSDNSLSYLERGKRFNQNLIGNINSIQDIGKMSGFSDKDTDALIENSIKNAGIDVNNRDKLVNKLESFDMALQKSYEGDSPKKYINEMNKQVILTQVQNMLSNENYKKMQGKANNAELIETWLKMNPGLEEDSVDNYLSTGLRGLVDMPLRMKLQATGFAKEHPAITASVILATLATGGAFALGAGGVGTLAATGGATTLVGGMALSSSGASAVSSSMATINATVTGMSYAQCMQNIRQSQGDYYSSLIQDGIAPDVAYYMAFTVGAVNGSIENFSLHNKALLKVPGFKSALTNCEKLSVKACEKYLKGVAATIGAKALATSGLETLQEVGEEVSQAYVENLGREISKKMTNENVNLAQAILNNKALNPLDNFEIYKNTASQTIKGVWLVSLLGGARGAGEDIYNNYSENKLRLKASDIKNNEIYKNFVFKEGGLDRFFDVVNDPKASSQQKYDVASVALEAWDSLNMMKKLKIDNFSEAERKDFERMKNLSRTTFTSAMKTFKDKGNIDFIPSSDINENKRKLVHSILDGLIEDSDDLNSFLNLSSLTCENYANAHNISGFVEETESLYAKGYSTDTIARKVADKLPRSEKKKLKTQSQRNVRAMEYVNAVLDVNKASDLLSYKAKMSALDDVKNSVYTDTSPDEVNVNEDKSQDNIEPIVQDNENSNKLNIDIDRIKNAQFKEEKVPVNAIVRDKSRFNVRYNESQKHFDFNKDDKISLYKDSNGVYYVIDGNRRLDAFEDSEQKFINADVYSYRDINSDEAKLIGIKKNIDSHTLDPMDLNRLVKDGQIDKSIADKLVKDNDDVASQLSFLPKLDDSILKACDVNNVSSEKAGEIARSFPNSKDKQRVLFNAIDDFESKGKLIENSDIKNLATVIGLYDDFDSSSDKFLGDNNIYEKLDLLSYVEKSSLDNGVFNDSGFLKRGIDNLRASENFKGDISESDVLVKTVKALLNNSNADVMQMFDEACKKAYKDPYAFKNFVSSVSGYIKDNDVDVYGKTLNDYNLDSNKLYKQAKSRTNPISALFHKNYNGDMTFIFDGELNKALLDKIFDVNKMTVLISKNANMDKVRGSGLAIESLKGNDYFNDTIFFFDGNNERVNLTKEELEKYGYKGYEEGEFEIKGYTGVYPDSKSNKLQGILLHRGNDKETIFEEVLHSIYGKEKSLDSSLFKEIDKWEDEVCAKASEYGLEVPLKNELFAKAFTSDVGGYLKDNLSNEIFTVPDNIKKSVFDIVGDKFIRSVKNQDLPSDVAYNEPRFSKDKVKTKGDRLMADSLIDVDSDSFKNFFGKSLVLDFEGKPYVLYGTGFNFDTDFYSDDRLNKRDEVYVKIEKPYFTDINSDKVDRKALKDSGYDGIIQRDSNGEIKACSILNNPLDQVMRIYDDAYVFYQMEKANEKASPGVETSKFSEHLERKGFSDEAEKIRKEGADKYEYSSNESVDINARKYIDSKGTDYVLEKLSTNGINNIDDFACAKILMESNTKDPRMTDLLVRCQEYATRAGKELQFISSIGKTRKDLLLNVGNKVMNEALSPKENEEFTNKAKRLKDDFKEINARSVRNIDFNKLEDILYNNKDSDYVFNNLKNNLTDEAFNSVIKNVSEKTGKSPEEILLNGASADDFKGNEDVYNKILRANDINVTDVRGKANDIKNACLRYFDGKGEYLSMVDEISSMTGISKDEARVCRDFVLNSINENTKAFKEERFKELSKKGDPEIWKFALDKLSDNNSINEDLLKGEIAIINGKPGMNYAYADRISNANEGDYNAIEADLYRQIPSKMSKSLKSFRIMSMLLNPKTMLRNIGSNAIFGGADSLVCNSLGGVIDKGISAFTGERTTPISLGNPIKNVKTGIENLKRGYEESKLGYASGGYTIDYKGDKLNASLDMEETNKFELERGRTFENGIFKNLETVCNIGLTATDKAFTAAAAQDVFDGLVKAQESKGKVLNGNDINDLQKIAIGVALQRTFNDSTKLSEGMSGIKNTLNKFIHLGDFGVGDLILPFARTPANIASRVVDYTPVIGAVNSIVRFNKERKNVDLPLGAQKHLANGLARSIAGGGFIYLGYLLANSGLGTGSYDDDDDSQKLRTLKSFMGEQYDSVNVSALGRFLKGGLNHSDLAWQDGDNLYSYEWCSPISASVKIGYALAKDTDKTSGVLKNFLDSVTSISKNLTNSDVTSNLYKSISRGGKDEFAGVLVRTLADMPATFVPSFINNIGQLQDNTFRVTKDENLGKEVVKKMQYRLPVAKSFLEARRDIFGNEVKYNDVQNNFTKFYMTFLGLGKFSKYREDEVTSKLMEIYKATGSTDCIPGKFTNSYGENKAKLSDKEHAEMEALRGQMIWQRYLDTIPYMGDDNEENIKELKAIVKECNDDVRAMVLGTHPEFNNLDVNED